jgi:hypothetical protein
VEKFGIDGIEFCKIIEGAGSNYVMKQVMTVAFMAIKNFEKVCRTKGQINYFNISTPNSPIALIWPPGYYRTIVKVYDNFDENIYTFLLDAIWK